MKAPKYMNSRFDSTCCDCGATIKAGERIRYLGRSKAECSKCMPAESNAAPASNDWAGALAWDDHEPIPGQSIGAHNSTPVAEIVKPSRFQRVVNDNQSNCEICGKVDELSHNEPTGKALCNSCDTEYSCQQDDDQLAEVGAQIIEQAQAKAAPVVDPLDDISNADRAEALTSELLIILVNAIDVAGISGRHTLQAFCKDNAKRSIEMSSRQHIWYGIAQAINNA